MPLFFLSSCFTKKTQIQEFKKNSLTQQKNIVPTIIIPKINLNLIVRTKVAYDGDGYPLQMGELIDIELKNEMEYKIINWDYVQKMKVMNDSSEELLLKIYLAQRSEPVYQEKLLSKSEKSFSTANPLGQEKDKDFQEWMPTYNNLPLHIKVYFKNKIIFSGSIVRD